MFPDEKDVREAKSNGKIICLYGSLLTIEDSS